MFRVQKKTQLLLSRSDAPPFAERLTLEIKEEKTKRESESNACRILGPHAKKKERVEKDMQEDRKIRNSSIIHTRKTHITRARDTTAFLGRLFEEDEFTVDT